MKIADVFLYSRQVGLFWTIENENDLPLVRW